MPPIFIKVRVTPGTPVPGLWCPYCLLPSGYQVPMLAISPHGVTVVGHMAECYDCQRRLPPCRTEEHCI